MKLAPQLAGPEDDDARIRQSSYLQSAVHEATRIRQRLVQLRHNRHLSGDCALASLMLADALDAPETLRHIDNASDAHVWNVVDNLIIDITATQFNYTTNDPFVRGVLVTAEPRSYHLARVGRGRGHHTLAFLTACPWYDAADDSMQAQMDPLLRKLIRRP